MLGGKIANAGFSRSLASKLNANSRMTNVKDLSVECLLRDAEGLLEIAKLTPGG